MEWRGLDDLSHDVTQSVRIYEMRSVCSGLSVVQDHVRGSVNVDHRVVLKHVSDVAIICAVICS